MRAGSGFPLGALGGIIPAALLLLGVLVWGCILFRRKHRARLHDVSRQALDGPIKSPWDQADHQKVEAQEACPHA